VHLLDDMQPRDLPAARRIVSALCAVGVAVAVLFLPITPDNQLDPNPVLMVLGVGAMLTLAGLSVAAWFFDEASRISWAVCPFLAIVAIVLIDVATSDSSVSAQIFLLFPTLYAASMLPRRGAAMVTVAAIAGDLVVVFNNLPASLALVDAGYMAAALIATAALLVRSAERQVLLINEFAHRARIDPLTGLVTRRAFEEAAYAALSMHPNDDGTALVLLDVDWFKSVNDEYGHPGGDEVLVQLADLLLGTARKGDVVCRLGGDELALLLPGCTHDVAHRRAEQMIQAVSSHGFALSLGSVIKVSVSAGLAHSPTNASDLHSLYRAADAALYEAKRAGRNRVVAQAGAA
jgi:diguanylate cyclase (GGDEF)-like protein